MIRDILYAEIAGVVKKLFDKKVDFVVSWDGKFADYASNVAMLFQNPQESAEKVKKELLKSKNFKKYFKEEIEIAGPGFLNFRLTDEGFEKGLEMAQKEKFRFGDEKIQLEFISANPTGPLTLGNGRGGVYGDVLGNVLSKAGHKVTKEYYINDAGGQIESLGHSVLGDEEAKYSGEYIDELAKKIKGEDVGQVGQKAQQAILKGIKETVSEMGIDFDLWFSENDELRKKGKVDKIVKWLDKEDLSYEKDNALWFKSTKFGDSEDRVLIKEDGTPTYFLVDCAYHFNKLVERKFDKVVNIWGADHHGAVTRLKGFVEALGHKDKLEIVLMQFVRLVKDGKSMKMSKREGNFVLVDDVIKEVGRDVFRYFMLTRSPNTHMDFDMNLAKEQSKKNPVYYIQYAGARMQSILTKSKTQNHKFQINSKLEILNSKHERNLILKLIQYPEIVVDTAKDYQVHRLTTYVHELAQTFSDFYENVRVLDEEDKDRQEALLGLVEASRTILERSLILLGISAPEKM